MSMIFIDKNHRSCFEAAICLHGDSYCIGEDHYEKDDRLSRSTFSS
ncbi:unnamed protein product [Acidithrix sp. C25]|nr:unnamed protein product [Acidithrix sp. C25]